MSALATTTSAALAAATGVPLAVLSLELAAGLLPGRRHGGAAGADACAVLIPAHDEAVGIVATLTALRQVAPPETRVLVVADNCSDETAELARGCGVEVAERHDTARRGKGYALAFGRERLADGVPPEVVLVLDADCRLSPGSIEALYQSAILRQAPAQAVNLIAPDLSAPPMVQISSFAMVVKNLFRSRGMQRMGGAALLTGTGMAFPWPLFADADLATGSIVEDLSLGIEMTRAGHAPRLVEAAQVRSAPASLDVALQQRRRWEHGFLDTLRRQALPVLTKGLARGSLPEVLLGLHLMVPPLALLLLLATAALAGCLLSTLAGASVVPVAILGGLLALSLALVAAAWLLDGRTFLSGGALLRAPLYVLWKIPIYFGFLRKPEASWTRTPRENQ